MNKNLFILRLIISPFLLIVAAVPMLYRSFYLTFLFVRWGGEFISYRKDDKPTIFSIYQHLKNNQSC